MSEPIIVLERAPFSGSFVGIQVFSRRLALAKRKHPWLWVTWGRYRRRDRTVAILGEPRVVLPIRGGA